MRKKQQRSRPGGFTLLELLVSIGIIVILIGILLPVISNVRRAAYDANSRSQIMSLVQAIERYRQEFIAYPGPLPNSTIIANSPAAPTGLVNATGTENLVLALMGGLKLTVGTSPVLPVLYDAADVGRGPMTLNPMNYKRIAAYINVPKGELSDGAMNTMSGYSGYGDTQVPDILDRFPDPMPVLYLRAKVGAGGIIADNNNPDVYQYDLRQIAGYISGKADNGLQSLGGFSASVADRPANALAYFKHPQLGGSNNAAGTPRQKDGFILISAGKDRLYGTLDDIANFGSLE